MEQNNSGMTGGTTNGTVGGTTGGTNNGMTGGMTNGMNNNMNSGMTNGMTGGVTGGTTGAPCNPVNMGTMPDCAYLANPYVPFQQNAGKRYEANSGIVRGTLFPGLDLPFMDMVNKSELPATPMNELMALNFAIQELTLYLDTHPKDSEAFSLLKSYISLYKEGKKKYTQMYGPISVTDLENAKSFAWVRDPWPWEYTEGSGDN